MDMIVNLLVAGLVVISVALAVARIRARRRLEESQRELVEARREFGKSIERLFEIVTAQDRADASRRSPQRETSAFYGGRRARSVSQSGRAAFCGSNRRYGATQPAYWARHSRMRFAESHRWEDEWTSHEDYA